MSGRIKYLKISFYKLCKFLDIDSSDIRIPCDLKFNNILFYEEY